MKSLAQLLLRLYKWLISPLLPPACRYIPTCSEYALEAVEQFGVLRGGIKAIWRLLRCNPLSAGGYDPCLTSPPAGEGLSPSAQDASIRAANL